MQHHRRTALALLVSLILASGLVACTGFTIAGGIAGGVLTLVALVLWLTTATSQSGCAVQACLSLVADGGDEPEVGPCLSQILDVGPCLGAPLDVGPCLSSMPDLSHDVGEVGPCLSPPPPDAGDEDAGIVGPCLSQPPPDASEEDAGDEDGGPIGPCLSLPPPDAEVDDDAGGSEASPDVARAPRPGDPLVARRETIQRLRARGVLSADVAARLVRSDDEEA